MKFSLQDNLRKLSLWKRISLTFGMILAIMTIGGLIMFLTIQSVTDGYQHTIDHFGKMEKLFSSVRIQMLEMTRTEKDFFASKDEIYVDLMDESFSSFQEVFQEATKIKQEVIDESTLTKIKGSIQAYNTAFKEAVNNVNKSIELKQKIDQLTETIEAEAKQSTGNRALFLTEMASSASRFMSTNKESYLKALGESSAKLPGHQNGTDLLNFSTSYGKTNNLVLNQSQSLQLNLMKAEEEILAANDKLSKATSDRVAQMIQMTQAIEIGIVVGILSVMTIIVIILVQTSYLTKNISSISEKIRLSSHDTFLSSETLKSASSQVSKSASEQASAIQETVATLNQITAMVNRSVDNAQTSTDKASLSHRIANEGKDSVVKMRQSMREIEDSITSMSTQVAESNQQIESIVKIIGEISDKTTVINDIVFQTKLLSFNASVEAARAGEHGKGFAVVAEEVGNLAQMSGNAAKEIAELLGRSRDRVQNIVQKSKEEMDRLVNEGSQRVSSGIDISNRCEEILVEVVEHVSNVKELMTEIAHASKEQAEGVNNISIAMNELDETTHSNSNMAHETSNCSNELATQSTNLSSAVKLLEIELHGTNYKGNTVNPSQDETRSSTSSVEQDLAQNNVLNVDEDETSVVPIRNGNTTLVNVPSAEDPGFDDDDEDDGRLTS